MRCLSLIAILLFGVLSEQVSFAKQSLTVGTNGVGPITSKTAFNHNAISKLLPDYRVKKSTSSTEGEEFSTVEVYDGKKLLFTVNPTEGNKSIFSIRVESNDVKNNLGHKIGDLFKNVYSPPERAKCTAGMEEMSGKVLCEDAKAKNVLYIFNGAWEGPDGTLPPTNVLSIWKIEGIVWMTSR